MIGSQLHVEALNETERGIVIEIKCNVQILLTKMCYSIPFPYDDFTKGKNVLYTVESKIDCHPLPETLVNTAQLATYTLHITAGVNACFEDMTNILFREQFLE